jgi:hypothetical protein
MHELDRKPFQFPRWAEVILIVVLLVMCVVEWMHAQFFWSLLFGVGAVGFGISLCARILKGDDHDRHDSA